MATKLPSYGPVTDPLNTDWTAYSAARRRTGEAQESIDAHIRRRVARSRMQRFRAVPVHRRCWYVTLTATVMDESQFGSHDLAAGLSLGAQDAWVLSRRKAKTLVEHDRAAGGQGTMYPLEYRLCPVCGKTLLGPAAYEYRIKLHRPISRWQYPEGPACSPDCKPRTHYNTQKRRQQT